MNRNVHFSVKGKSRNDSNKNKGESNNSNSNDKTSPEVLKYRGSVRRGYS